MSAVPAAGYLVEFGGEGDTNLLHASAGAALRHDRGAAAKLEEALQRGVESGRIEAQRYFYAKLEEQRGEFAAKLGAERQQWAAGAGEELAKRLLAAVAEFEGRVADTIARILKPFLAAELRRQAVSELQANLEALLTSDPGVNLSISGPADILDVLRQQLAGRTATATYTPSQDCDVRIVAGQAMLETQLQSWMAKLEEATR
jgi:hypothetical protein